MMGLLKTRENARVLADYIQRELPPLYTALIAERDEYMANSLLQSPGKRMVAVTGLAHMDGIERRFRTPRRRREDPATERDTQFCTPTTTRRGAAGAVKCDRGRRGSRSTAALRRTSSGTRWYGSSW